MPDGWNKLNGHDPLILLAIEDVTEHKRQATELRELAADLSETGSPQR